MPDVEHFFDWRVLGGLLVFSSCAAAIQGINLVFWVDVDRPSTKRMVVISGAQVLTHLADGF